MAVDEILLPGRLPLTPGTRCSREAIHVFWFNDMPVEGYSGESVAAALWAVGRRLLGRSWKFHRPRGPFCFSGCCGRCLVEVDGVPNVPACMEPVRQGLRVKTQGGFPSIDHDLLALLDFLSPLFPAGFQHRYFSRPSWLFRGWAEVLRWLAGSARGRAHPPADTGSEPVPPLEMSADVAVIGGGVSGLAAAREAAPYVRRMVIIDRQPTLGGILSWLDSDQEIGERLGWEQELSRQEGVEIMTETTAIGYYGDGLLGLVQRERFVKLHAGQIIVATGAYEQPLLFTNNDVPGIISLTAAARLVSHYRILPARSALVAVRSDQGILTALRLHRQGLPVSVVIDSRPHLGRESLEQELFRARIIYFEGYTPHKALGRRDLEGVVFVSRRGDRREMEGDLLITEGELRPANELAFHALYEGMPLLEAPNRFFSLPIQDETGRVDERLYVVGGAAGRFDRQKAIVQGKLAGISAALALGQGGDKAIRRREELLARLQAL